MARYCDLDELIETFEERNRNTCNGSLTCLQLLRMLKKIPAADVAPKSEVERLTVELDAMRAAANSYKMHYNEVANEILSEINSKLDSFRSGIFDKEEELIIISKPEYYAIFVELKKKYMEAQE